MILISGLGNPEKQYLNTRHNIGFMAIDLLHDQIAPQDKWSKSSKLQGEIVKTESFLLLKPTTYMNLSGKAVKAAQQMYKIEPSNIWILHDDLDLELGRLKIQIGGGAAGHNGIKSIMESLGTSEFTRWRIGIGRPPHDAMDSADFVLDKLTKSEETILFETLRKASESIHFAAQNTVIATMNKYN
ncbi:MAG: aminoacyl-tRNA hydrolase [bacterium]|nr:aminoacyl-tRNA hydrolase [bacterium]